jgi:DNA-binding GntR family transcriptional regulator
MKRANEIAYNYIKSRIINGTYLPAQRLVEAQLSEDIGVSRNTVKKALLKIQQEKLITIEDNKGAAICSLSLEEVLDYLEVREALEMIIASHAAVKISDKDIAELKIFFEKMQEHMKQRQFEEYSRINKEFHKIIYKVSDKPVAVDMALGIRNQLNRFQIRTMLAPGRAGESLQEHKDILKSMQLHDPQMAQEKVGLHIRHVAETIRKYHGLLFS